MAQRDFFEGKIKNSIDFIYLNFRSNGIKEITIEEILNFIQGPETLLNYYKEEFLSKYIQNLYVNFKNHEAYKKCISEIENDKSNILHKQKFVKEAVKDKKSVNITILKDEKTLTFKADTSIFLRLETRYSNYNIKSKDRKIYKELFNNSDYSFDEIISITYGKQGIYNKETGIK